MLTSNENATNVLTSKPTSKPPRARKQKTPVVADTHEGMSSHENSTPIHTQPPTIKRDKAQEMARLFQIIEPLAKRVGRDVSVFIPLANNDTFRCPLATSKGNNDARKWIFNRYQELYGGLPLVSSYNQVCVQLEATLLVSTVSSGETPAGESVPEDESKPKHPVDELVKDVAAHAETPMLPSVDARASYARVPDTDIRLRGIWRVDGRKTKRLTDAYVRVLRLERPHSDNKHARYRSLTLQFIDAQGVAKDITVTDEQMLGTDLGNKLAGFAMYPETDIDKRYFAEAIAALARIEGTIQDETECLGWHTTDTGSLVWSMVNGCETVSGFIPRKDAPFLAPDIPSLRHGYYGQAVTPSTLNKHEGDWWDLRLNHFAPHPDVRSWQLASIGMSCAVMLPDGIAPEGIGIENGTLRLSPDLVGKPESGKSREVNNMLSLFGTRFLYNTSPLLTIGKAGKADTNVGRNGTMAMMKYHMIADGDHKAAPGTSEHGTQHELRNATITAYVDGEDGGKKSQRNGKKIGRDVAAGCDVRTCNYDHAPASIDEGNLMVERRACSFIWPTGIRGNDDISRLLDKTRGQAYATGQAYRRWIMKRVATERDEFKDVVSMLSDIAHTMASDKAYTWAYVEHRNQIEIILVGLLVFQKFLEDVYPEHWLHKWIDTYIPELLANRASRSQYIQELANKREEEQGIDTFVLSTLRYLLSTQNLYIRSQQDALLTDTDIEGLPMGMKDIGYRSVVRDDVETWEAGRQCIGYLVHKGRDIAFITHLLMEDLQRESNKKNITLDTERHTLATLVEKGVIIPERSKDGTFKQYEQLIKLNGKPARFAVMPVTVLFVTDEDVVADEEIPEDERMVTPDNVIHFPTQTAVKPLTMATDTVDARNVVNGDSLPYKAHEQDAFCVSEDEIEEF